MPSIATSKRRVFGWLGLALAGIAMIAGCAPPQQGPVDMQAPKLLSVEANPVGAGSPGQVQPGQQLTISAVVSDNVGVTGVSVLVGRNGQPATFCSGPAFRTAGSLSFGTWELTCTIPPTANSGVYELGVLVTDARLNSVSSAGSTDPAIATSFLVLGTTSDTEAPVVDSVVSTPTQLTAGSPLTITAHVTDDTGATGVTFAVRRAGQSMGWCLGAATLTSGTNTDGVWTLNCTVPPGAAPASYRVNTVTTDVQLNIGGVIDSPDDLASGPFTVQAPPAN